MVTIRHRYTKRQYWNTLAHTVETVHEHEAETIAEVCWRTFQEWLRLRLHQNLVSVPIFPSLTDGEIDVGRTLRKVVGIG